MPRSRSWWIYLAAGLLAIGVYFVLPTSADDLLRKADAAMYRVKVATLGARHSARDAA